MSRSDNTEWRRERKLLWRQPYAIWRNHDWQHKWSHWGFPAGTGQENRRLYWKAERARTREAIARGRDPEPSRTRSSVKYDYWLWD
jgi:hypothetical protein